MSKTVGAPFPLPEKTKIKFSSSSPFSSLRLKKSSLIQKEKTSKGGDPEYEEIGPQRNHKEIHNESKNENSCHCDLCGSSDAEVRCDKCNFQAFCSACDETYHGHPKRSNHSRKSLKENVNHGRPPLPSKIPDGVVGPTPAAPPPQPPPRKNKKGLILPATFGPKDQNDNETGRTLMGSLKKIMGGRPLPLPPDQNLDKRRSSTPNISNTNNITNSSPVINYEGNDKALTVGLPQSIIEINSKAAFRKPPSSMPPTPPSAAQQYPKIQPQGPPVVPGRKFSLQQFPPNFENKRASLIDGTTAVNNSWDKQQSQHPNQHPQQQQQQQQTQEMLKLRSQSVSDDQWHQMIALHGGHHPSQGFTGSTTASEVGGIGLPRRPYNTMSGAIRPFGRGMVSSASVCDLNSLNQQQHQQQQQLHQSGAYPNIHSANSFQQLSVMSYDPNMVWVQPSPCTLCQTPQMFSHAGMKRTTSNISMNLSSVGSDITGYPWPPHVHHQMPMGYPGYYPGCHPHMIPAGYTQGSAMSIPDSMKSYNRRPPSPAPSARSSSHRSHKSSKSRSFNVDAGRRSRNHSRKRSEESEESESSSISDEHNLPVTTKSSKPGGLAWQCDHCTFINPGHVQACGMCSKVPGKTNGRTSRRGNDRRKSDKRRDKRTDSGENIHNVSDYENDQKKDIRRDNRLKSSSSVKSSSGRSKKKSRRKESSPSHSSSGSGSDDEGEEAQVETQLRDLRITSRSRAGEYDGYSVTSRTREKEKERSSLKKEGGGSRYRNRRRYHSERSMTPARSSPSRRSRKSSINSDEKSSNENKSSNNDLDEIIPHENKSSHEGTLVGTTASESNTLKKISSKENSKDHSKELTGSLKHWNANQSLNKKNKSHSDKSESQESSELEDPFDPPKDAQKSEKSDKVEENINIKEAPIKQEELPKSREKSEAESDQDEENRSVKEKEYEKPDDKLYQGHLAPSDAKGDVDEPSFANTLDGIETMGTNEVADYDPSQVLEYKIEDSEQILQDINNLLPEVNAPLYNKIDNNEYDLYEKSDHEKENIKEKILYKKDKEVKDEKKAIKINSPQDPSYEVIDNPKENEIKERTEKLEAQSNDRPEKNKTNTLEDDPEEHATESESNKDENITKKDNELPENEKEFTEEGLESLSSENSNEVLSPRRDRQHTPLSISSSDVQFYSPPNSPDLSLSEKLHGKRMTNEHNQTSRPSADGDLVTALETMQMMAEHCSSKDTFQSSYDQLSEEMYDDDSSEEEEEEDEKEEATKPSSVAVTLPPAGETKQGYSNFASPKAQSQSISLVKSVSDKDLSSRSHPNEEKYEKVIKITKPKRSIEKEVVFSDEEEEVDEKFLTVEELIKRRKQKSMKEQGLQLVQILREAEEKGYNPEEVSVALTLCEKNKSPVEWLQENWRHMVDTVVALASAYRLERSSNNIGEITSTEAKKALRAHKGNIWEAVTSCVEERQKKYDDLVSRGNFKREDIIKSLTDHEGDTEKAFLELSKPHQLGSFFSKIWEGIMESMPRVIPERSKADALIQGERKEKIMTFQESKQEKQIKKIKKQRKSRKKKVAAPTTNDETESEISKSGTKIYADILGTNSTTQTDEETENEIYENFVNPLLEKLGDSLPKREDGNPLISEELKRKIVQAILEGDNDTANENVVFDSDEESTIEELLAVAENPTFYDYFTAVDLEDFEEISERQDDESVKEDNEGSSSYDSPGTVSEEEKGGGAKVYEEGPILTEGVQSDFEYFDEFKSVDNPTTDEEDEEEIAEQNEEVQFIREEDVVVHPLKAFSHYANLSKAKYVEEKDAHAGKSHSFKQGLKVFGQEKEEITPEQNVWPTGVSGTAYRNASTFMQTMKWFFSLERKGDQNKSGLENQASAKQENAPKRPEVDLEAEDDESEEQDDESEEQEDEEEEDDETEIESQHDEGNLEADEESESVSITTGRLNLALTQTPDQGADIGMKSHTVQTEQSNHLPKSPAQLTADYNIKNEPTPALEKEEETKFKKAQEVKTTISPPSVPPLESKSIPPRSGPVTVQKATFIVGKAIAKAMARESSIRRDSIPSESDSEKGSPSPASTPESEELPEIAPIGSKLTKPQSSESKPSGSVTAPLKPETSADAATAATAAAAAAPASAPAKALSIPPAVASFSGPIFIPSSSASAAKASSDYSNPPHTYYNEPLKVESSPSASQKDVSAHYETIREALKPNADLRERSDAKPQIAAVALPPTHSESELVSKPQITAVASLPPTHSESELFSKPQIAAVASLPPTHSESELVSKPQIAAVASLPPTHSERPLATDQKRKSPVNDKGTLPTSSPKSTDRVKPSITEDKIAIKPSTSKENNNDLKETKIKHLSPKEALNKNTKQTKNAKNSNLLPKSPSNASKPNKIGSGSDIPGSSRSKPQIKDERVSETQEEKQASSTKATVKKPPAVPKTRTFSKGKSKIDSSGESQEEEDEEEEEKIETELEKVENLKNRKGAEVGDKEVQELKEQILLMRKELESKMDSDDEEDSNRSSTLKVVEASADPLVMQAPAEGGTEAAAEKEEENEEEETEKEEKEEENEEEETEKEEKEETIQEEVTVDDKQQYEQLKFDRTVRRLLAEGQATTYEKAELAAQLLTLSFDETDSIQAAEGCSSIYTALQFLQQECELCAEKYPMGKMVSMLHCVHRCCYDCANTYFSFQIKTKNIRELRCPFCEEPDLDASEEIAAEYLNNLDILLKNILDQETHELFQRKLRDWTLMKDPNFRWCNKCSSGFIANPRARKLICPDCKDVTCAMCRKEWEAQHTGISCEVFAQWKEENEPETQQESVAKHLAENGITCPNCRFTYSLAKGGCMHFTCTECKHEFCSGCSQPFRQGAKCHVGPYCERLGLHSHHPRNCLFYLRDKEPGQLQQLLKEHNIEYDTEISPDTENQKKVCRVPEQKETMEGLRDDICGRFTQDGYAGLCRLHYIEYLVEKINSHGLDPVSIFDEADLRVCLRRNGKTVPVRRWESEKLYRDKLIKLIKEQLPLA